MQIWAVDVETGGIDPTRDPLIEVAYVNYGGDKEVSFSLPFDEKACDPKALEVNGWGKREFAPELHPDVAASKLVTDWRDSLIIASPSWFDIGFIVKWLGDGGYKPSWSHRAVVDLKSLYCGKLDWLYPFKNSVISENLGVPDASDHTALGDARWTMELFRAMRVRVDLP